MRLDKRVCNTNLESLVRGKFHLIYLNFKVNLLDFKHNIQEI